MHVGDSLENCSIDPQARDFLPNDLPEAASSPAETSAIRLPVIRHPQLHEDRINQSHA